MCGDYLESSPEYQTPKVWVFVQLMMLRQNLRSDHVGDACGSRSPILDNWLKLTGSKPAAKVTRLFLNTVQHHLQVNGTPGL